MGKARPLTPDELHRFGRLVAAEIMAGLPCCASAEEESALWEDVERELPKLVRMFLDDSTAEAVDAKPIEWRVIHWCEGCQQEYVTTHPCEEEARWQENPTLEASCPRCGGVSPLAEMGEMTGRVTE